MSKLIDELSVMGCDMKVTMERFMDDEEFYAQCFESMLTDEGFEKLGEALKTHDIDVAFDIAHMLKGIIVNMGITSLYETIVPIVESLRKRNDAGLEPAYKELMAEREKYRSLL